MANAGMVKAKVERALLQRPYYEDFLKGTSSRRSYHRSLVDDEPDLVQRFGLTADEVRFASRYPRDEEAKVDECLTKLYDAGLVPSRDYDKQLYREYAEYLKVMFDHGGRQTFIYPEEGRLVFALADILRPQRSVTLGSFYGWWAFWTLPAVQLAGGKMVLVDSDPMVCEIALRNICQLGFDDSCEVSCTDAIDYLGIEKSRFDFILLDAEGPPEALDASRSGKAVYGPILASLAPCLLPKSVLVCHNILFDHEAFRDDYLQKKATIYANEYERFFRMVRQTFGTAIYLDTTEGVGVYGDTLSPLLCAQQST